MVNQRTPEGFYRRAYPLLVTYLALSALICAGIWTHAARPLIFAVFALWALTLIAEIVNLLTALPATRPTREAPTPGDRTGKRMERWQP